MSGCTSCWLSHCTALRSLVWWLRLCSHSRGQAIKTLHATWPKINENKIDIYNIENKHCWHNPTPRKTEKTSVTGIKVRLVMPRVYQGRGAFSDWISFQIRKWGESKKMCHQATLCFSIINHDCAFSTWKEKGGRGPQSLSSRAVVIVSYSWLPFPHSIA